MQVVGQDHDGVHLEGMPRLHTAKRRPEGVDPFNQQARTSPLGQSDREEPGSPRHAGSAVFGQGVSLRRAFVSRPMRFVPHRILPRAAPNPPYAGWQHIDIPQEQQAMDKFNERSRYELIERHPETPPPRGCVSRLIGALVKVINNGQQRCQE